MDRKWWTLIAVCTGVFMLLLDITIVNVALPQIETRVRSDPVRSAVGDRRLRADARGAAADRGLDRRPRRPPSACSPPGSSSSRSARRSAASPRARCSCRCHGRCRASAARSCSRPRWRCWPRRSRRGARRRVCRVRCDHRHRRRRRAGARRRDHQRAELALDLLRQRPDRNRRPHRDAAARSTSRSCRTRRAPTVPGFVTFSLALAGLVFGLIRSQAEGWGSCERARFADRRRRPAGRVRRRSSCECASRCSTSRCCGSRRSTAGWSRPGRSRPRSSRC